MGYTREQLEELFNEIEDLDIKTFMRRIKKAAPNRYRDWMIDNKQHPLAHLEDLIRGIQKEGRNYFSHRRNYSPDHIHRFSYGFELYQEFQLPNKVDVKVNFGYNPRKRWGYHDRDKESRLKALKRLEKKGGVAAYGKSFFRRNSEEVREKLVATLQSIVKHDPYARIEGTAQRMLDHYHQGEEGGLSLCNDASEKGRLTIAEDVEGK